MANRFRRRTSGHAGAGHHGQSIVSATPETSVLEAAALLVDNRVSALLVMHDGVPIGIVSEADLLRRYVLGTQRDAAPAPWWRRVLGRRGDPWNYIEAHAMKLCDVITNPLPLPLPGGHLPPM